MWACFGDGHERLLSAGALPEFASNWSCGMPSAAPFAVNKNCFRGGQQTKDQLRWTPPETWYLIQYMVHFRTPPHQFPWQHRDRNHRGSAKPRTMVVVRRFRNASTVQLPTFRSFPPFTRLGIETAAPYLRLWPQLLGSNEGFFVACLRKGRR